MILKYRDFLPIISLVVLLMLTWYIYRPGINSTFFFDDFANIGQLQLFDLHGINWRSLIIYIDNAPGGPLKRPVSTLSFLLDDVSWPTQPYLFKRTNIKLHLLTGLVLLWLLWRIGINRREPKAWIFAWLGTAMWIANPYQVSTVLYAVQRMTILSALFCLSSLLVYCYGREWVRRGLYRRGYISLIFGVNLCFLLSVFSKENGLLTFWLILILDKLFLSDESRPTHKHWQLYQTVFLNIPSVVLAIGMIWQAYFVIWVFNGSYPNRDFDVWQRLLTESRIVWNYLYDLVIPKFETRGLLAQNYPRSHGLFEPVTTIISVAGILMALLFAVAIRRAYPLVAGAIIFFFVGHILESTYFGLELYFEHRNYLPSSFLFYGIVSAVGSKFEWSKNTDVKKYTNIFLAIWLIISFFFLSQRVHLWANEPQLVSIWAEKNSESSRALLYASEVMLESGYISQGREFIEKARSAEPDNPIPILHAAIYNCRSDRPLASPSKVTLNALLNEYPFSMTTFLVLKSLIETVYTVHCVNWTYSDLNDLADAYFLSAKATNPNERALGDWLKGYNAVLAKQADDAQFFFYRAAARSNDVVVGLSESAMLASIGQPSAAITHLELIDRRNHEINSDGALPIKARFQWIDAEIKRLMQLYRAEVEARAHSGD